MDGIVPLATQGLLVSFVTEVLKRWKWFPISPENPVEARVTAAVVTVVIVVAWALFQGVFVSANFSKLFVDGVLVYTASIAAYLGIIKK